MEEQEAEGMMKEDMNEVNDPKRVTEHNLRGERLEDLPDVL